MTKENKVIRKDKIIKGLEKAYKEMIEQKRKTNTKIAIIQNNSIFSFFQNWRVEFFLF